MSFDPYYELLGIPPKDQPPHHYRLLGIDPFEENPSVIQRAVDRQTVHVRSYQSGPHGSHTQRVLTDISVARLCLLDPSKKSVYDAELRKRLTPLPPAAPPPPPKASARAAGSGINLGQAGSSGIGIGGSSVGVAGSGINLSGNGSQIGSSGINVGGSGSNSDVLVQQEAGGSGRGSSRSGSKVAAAGGSGVSAAAPVDDAPMSPWMLAAAVGGGLAGGGLLLLVVLWLKGGDTPSPPVVQKPPVVDPNGKQPKPADPTAKPKPQPKPMVDPNPLPMVVIPPTPPVDPPPVVTPPVDPLPMLPVIPATPVGQDSGQIPGLVLYAPLDEGTGTTTVDQVTKIKGAFKGTPQWAEGKFGNALQFDSRAHVEFGRVLAFEADQPFSMGGWVWIDAAATDGTIGGKMLPGGKKPKGYELFLSSGGVEANLSTSPNTVLSVEQPSVTRGQWFHLMSTYGGSRTVEDLTLYLNGRQVGKRTGTTMPGLLEANTPFCIGGRNGTYGFLGKIDEFRVYSRKLSDEEVSYIYSNDPAALAAPLTARRVALDLDPDGAPADVLPLIDAKQDSIAGDWTPGEKNALASPATDGVFQLPVSPPLRYKLTLIGTRTSETGELTIGLPIGSQMAAATFFGATPVSVGDLEGMAEVSTNDKITPVGEFVIICEGSPEGVKIRVNGEDAVAWEGQPNQVALPAKWQPRSQRQPFVATTGGTFQIARVQLARPTLDPGARLAALPPPPTEEELKDVLITVRADYQKAIRTARTPEARVAVAEELVVKGKATPDAKTQYALLTQARDAAAQAGGAELALDAIDFLAQKYRIDVWDQKAKALTEAVRIPQIAPARQMQLARQATEMAAAAALADQYAAADKLLDIADTTATKFKDNDTKASIKQQRDEYDLLSKVAQEAVKARQTLARDPTDAASHLALGRYYCFAQDDWSRGAKEFRQSGDPKLMTLADAELAAATAETRKAAGEGWWRHAQVGNDPCKALIERHGCDLLAEALPGLSPPVQKETLRFVSQMFVQTPAAAPRPTRRGLKAWFKADEGVQQQAGQVHTWNDSSGNNNHARQDKPQYAMKLVPNAFGGRPVLRAEEASGQGFSFKLNDIGSYDGLTIAVVANTREVDRNELFLALPGPDVIWAFGAYGNGLGYVGNNPVYFGNNKKSISADDPFLVTYRYKRKEGWQVDFKGLDAGYVADKQFPVAPQTFIIGNMHPNTTGHQPFGGDLAEILIYDHSLPAADYRELCMYLNLKYQLCFPVPTVPRIR